MVNPGYLSTGVILVAQHILAALKLAQQAVRGILDVFTQAVGVVAGCQSASHIILLVDTLFIGSDNPGQRPLFVALEKGLFILDGGMQA